MTPRYVGRVDSSGNMKSAATLQGLAMAIVLVATAAVFHFARNGDFLHWDDNINIVTNAHLRAPLGETLHWMFTDASYMRRYVPLAWLGWVIEYRLFGLTPQSAHVGNILLHAATAILVFLVLREVLACCSRIHSSGDGSLNRAGERCDDKPLDVIPTGSRRVEVNPFHLSSAAALIGALVWALHPLRVEVVAWASGRMYCQAGFFLLLAMLGYFRAVSIAAGRARAIWLVVSVLAYTASLLTYPIGLSFVVVLLVLDALMLRRFRADRRWFDGENRRVLLEKIPFLAIALLVAGATVVARFQAQGLWQRPPTLDEFGIGSRIAQACYFWMYYVWRPLFPSGLAPVYSTLVQFNPAAPRFVISVIAFLAVTVLVVWKRRQWPGAFALWLIHVALLAPMAGFTERPHYTNDRYSYIQGILWSCVIATLLLRYWPQRLPRLVLATAIALVCALGIASAAQIQIWRNDEALFSYLYHQLDDRVSRADVAFRLGDALRTQRRFDEAAKYYHESLRLVPQGSRAAVPHFGLGAIAYAQQQLQTAVNHYQAAIADDPRFAEAHRSIGEILIGAGRSAEAIPFLQRAAEVQPASADGQELLGVALFQTGKYGEAANHFAAGLRLRPDSLPTISNLMSALCGAGRAAEAVAYGERAVRLAPQSVDAHLKLAEALQAAGRFTEAIAAAEAAVKLRPASAAATHTLGTTLAVAGKMNEAVTVLRTATTLAPSSARAHYTLGLALRDTGQKAEAVAAFETALRLQSDYAAARDELVRLRGEQ